MTTNEPKLTEKNGKTYNERGEWVEFFEGRWTPVLNAHRVVGWWRYHDHYNREGYCDDPARGY